jgi:hypothetical protein
MGVWEELHAVAARLSLREDRQSCPSCGRGKLEFIAEEPDENFGALGMTRTKLRCDDPDCGKLTII